MARGYLSIVLITAVLAAGCASSVKTTMQTTPTEPLAKFKKIEVIVKSKVDDSADETAKFHRALATALANTRRWDLVGSNGEITVTATMIELTKVSQTARILVGAMAGQASIETDVVLTDATGKVLGQFHVKGKSSGGTIFAGTTDEAFEEAANEIASVLQRL